ncbi:multicopper oxidase domain-containing protein [Ornithinimicrobium pratense]|uniref:Copper-containing nitrite reductase n=1 Tax=Ornithinimicrobium pratense TaxID=2593973 RepID=A0A5J6V746_9MICO|nr:multicopper oxidase domain-containing protein [Ornithinimicrobium pratense]QFG69870.1 multicopper oxidase domain-containing protein [Ornithinimicrobium pratense]
MPDLAPAPRRTSPDGSGRARAGGSHGHWALRDQPALLWLVLALVMTAIHPFVAESRWLMVHLVLLGALTHAIMVWSTHFTQALLKNRPGLDDRRAQSIRLWLLLAGTVLTLVGVPTALWPITLAGACLVSVAVITHGVQLVRRLRGALPGRFRVTVRYYVAAAVALPVGAGFGATLALGLTDVWHGRLLLAHTMTMLLGWVGLTVTGTLLTLWPTMLRTRIAAPAERRATQALPGLICALALLVGGALLDMRWLSVVALVGYLASLAWWASAVLSPVRQAPPREFAPASVGAALLWGLAALTMVLWRLAGASDWADFVNGFGWTSAVIVVGFASQLLTGALAYLVPSVVGGGKTVVRAGARWFDRWGTARLVTINAGLLLCLLPVPSIVRVIVSLLVVAALATFIPLMVLGIRASSRAKREVAAARERGERPVGATRTTADGGPDRMPSVWSGGQLVAALSALVLAVSVGVAADPAAAGLGGSRVGVAGGGAATAVTPTGNTTTVTVEAHDMRFEPASITVPAGDRLVIELVNVDDSNVHDLQLLGERSPRLAAGESATLDVGVVGGPAQGWCTIVGHRQMGMVLDVVVEGADGGGTAASGGGVGVDSVDGGVDSGGRDGGGVDSGGRDGGGVDGSSHGGAAGHGAAGHPATATPLLDPDARVQDVVDPVLVPLDGERVHRLTLTAQELELEVAPGVTQTRWTFNGQVPGPTLRGRVGDVFEITLVNDGTLGHSIDFHAGALAPDQPMRTIAPGQSLVYRFTAERAGVWMYHCSTAPMSSHIAAGMAGAVIIEPAEGLPEVDREYVLVQSEVYLVPGSGQGEEPAAEVDADAVAAERPALVTFNGIAGQYGTAGKMLQARVGERVRFWVLVTGPNRPTSFHIVGGQFDTVYAEGAYQLGPRAERAGAQALALQPAQGGFVELTFPEAGHYPVVSHIMVDAERGAHGVVRVED